MSPILEKIFASKHAYSFQEQASQLPLEYLFDEAKEQGIPAHPEFQKNFYLENGGRFYLDCGDHPEYCIPECTSAWDLAVYQESGDQLVKKFVANSNKRLQEKYGEAATRLLLYKNNRGKSNEINKLEISYGCHENYLK